MGKELGRGGDGEGGGGGSCGGSKCGSVLKNAFVVAVKAIFCVVCFVIRLICDMICICGPSFKFPKAFDLSHMLVEKRGGDEGKQKKGGGRGEDGNNDAASRGTLEVLPEKIWPSIEDRLEEPQDWLNFMRMSLGMEKLEIPKQMEEKKTEKLFPAVIEHVFKFLEAPELLNLRLVCKNFKHGVDAQWRTMMQPQVLLPAIYLTDLHKISRFTREMRDDIATTTPSSNFSSRLPFEVLVGLASPTDPDYRDFEDEYMDRLTCLVFWRAFARSAEQIGYRVENLVFDIRIDPLYGTKFAEDIVTIIVTDCLKALSQIRHLVIITNTMSVEKALSGVYSVKDADPTSLPSLEKLESLEILTLGEGHPSKSKFKTRSITFPARFLRQHGSTVKRLRIYGNLYDFKTMGVFQAPNLERIMYEIHHCLCQGKEAELKALLSLPVVEQEEAQSLKYIMVKVNWQWRTSDISSFFKWLGRNYPTHKMTTITLRNSQNPLKSLDPNFNQHPPGHTKNDERKVNAYGSDFPWMTMSTLPTVKCFELYSEYEGSWEFLRAMRNSLESILLQKQLEFFRNEDKMIDIYKRGRVKDIFAEEVLSTEENGGEALGLDTVIWDYFPKLQKVTVVWRSINYKNVNWDLQLFARGEACKKDIIQKMRWTITREDYHFFRREREQQKGNGKL